MEGKEMKQMVMEELKKAGLDIAEEAAISAVKAVLAVLPKVVAKTENKYDDLLLPVLSVLEPKLMDLLDQIDGQEG